MPETVEQTDAVGTSSGGEGAVGQAQDKAREAASQAQDKARDVASQARSRARDEADRRSTQAGEQIGSAARDARSVADELRKQGKDTPARYAEQAAERAERVGGYLRDADGDKLLRDVEDFARSKPWAVVAGGMALGFMASRLLKASSTERYRSSLGATSSSGSSNGMGQEGSRFERETEALPAPVGTPPATTGTATGGVPPSAADLGTAGTQPDLGSGHGTKPSQFESHS
jgi:hypothetical protein